MTLLTGVWIILALAVGLLGGFLLARSRRNEVFVEDTTKVSRLEAELGEKELELADYKENVSDHFVETADLINQLTHSYKAVYDHLERGAFQLVGAEDLKKRLGNIEAEPVKLEYIGLKLPEMARESLYVVELAQSVEENDEMLANLSQALHISTEQARNLLKRSPGAITKAINLRKAEKVEAVFSAQGIATQVKHVEPS
ncbi:MAG: DUF1043 family protein [Trueperaceae bacterium]|nr:DUF1043 family protein [Trueperaceae bacterium]